MSYKAEERVLKIGDMVFEGFASEDKITLKREVEPKLWFDVVRHTDGVRLEFTTKEGKDCSVVLSDEIKSLIKDMKPTKVSPFSVTLK